MVLRRVAAKETASHQAKAAQVLVAVRAQRRLSNIRIVMTTL